MIQVVKQEKKLQRIMKKGKTHQQTDLFFIFLIAVSFRFIISSISNSKHSTFKI